jgi:type IX secretion system PorP/SprF family membrane protein
MKTLFNTLIIKVLLLGLFFDKSQAQDPQFSQFYANPLYINPALAGSGENARVMLNWRKQWPSLDVAYTTYSISGDLPISRQNMGLGLLYTSDAVTSSNFRSQDLGLQYAYNLQLNNQSNLRFGLQGALVSREFQFSNLIFGDQLQNYLQTGAIDPTMEAFPRDQKRYINVSSGLFWYSEKYWLGLSAHNMTRPRQDILDISTSRIPVRYTLQVGAKFPIVKGENYRDQYRAGYRERSFSPTLLYRHQGSFDQLDIGAYFTLEPIVFGFWYRGIPLKEYKIGIGNNESLIGLVGMQMGNLSFGYSYDFTISKLGYQTGGAHEISLRLNIAPQQRIGTTKKKYKSLPCPKF